jgi:hypothetical protein
MQPISSPVRKISGHNAGGRQGDAAFGERQSVAVGRDQQGLLDVVEIVERLAHAHHDDVGDQTALGRHDRTLRRRRVRKVAKPVAGNQDLGEDLFRRQIADQLLRAGMAEGAGERAADL